MARRIITFRTATDSYKPIIFLSILAGVCSTAVTKNGNLARSKRCVFWPVLSMLLGIVMFIVILHDAFLVVMHLDVKVGNQGLLTIVGIVVRTYALLKTWKALPKIMRLLHESDQLSRYSEHGSDGRFTLTMTVLILIMFICYEWILTLMIGSFERVTVYLYNLLGSAVSEAQYVSLCVFLRRRFRKLNRDLVELEGNATINNNELMMHTVAVIEKPHLNHASRDFVSLKDLRRAHHKLVLTCDLMARKYQFLLLISISTSFLSFLFNMYYAILGNYTVAFPGVYIHAGLGIYYFCKILMVCSVTSNLGNESDEIKRHLADLLNRPRSRDFKEELSIFMGFCASREIRISACGFFDVNLGLVTSVVSAFASYFIIFIQFRST